MKSVELLKENQFNFDDLKAVPEWNEEGMKMMDEMVMVSYLRKQLQEMMSDLVGIVRSNERLNLAKKNKEKFMKP
jgi:L-aspartate oxidase